MIEMKIEGNKSEKSIVNTLKKYDGKKALVQDNYYVSYSELANKIELIGTNLKNIGLQSVAIHIPNKIDVLVVALSCMNVGIPFIVLTVIIQSLLRKKYYLKQMLVKWFMKEKLI